MAAKYLLVIYTVVRILLVIREKKMEKRTADFCRWISDYFGYRTVHEGKQGYFWSAHIDWLLYAYYDSAGTVVEKM